MLLRLSSFFLTVLVLVGSVGLSVNRHFCMGELKSVAIFGEAKKCHTDQVKKSCPFHPEPAETEDTKKKGCCDDEHELVQIDEQEPNSVPALPTIVAVLPGFPPRLFCYRPPAIRRDKNTNFELYRPPPLIPDAVREFQVFRI